MAKSAQRKEPIWKLVALDNGVDDIEGQFPLETASESKSTEWGREVLPGRDYPATQWGGSPGDDFSFTPVYVDDPSLGKTVSEICVRTRLDLLYAIRSNADLGRPPRYRFEWGQISFNCVVQSLGGITYGRLLPNGAPQSMTFEIRLLQIPPTEEEIAGLPEKPAGQAGADPAKVVAVPAGESAESAAQLATGDPDAGTSFRQDQSTCFGSGSMVLRTVDVSRANSPAPVSMPLDMTDPRTAGLFATDYSTSTG